MKPLFESPPLNKEIHWRDNQNVYWFCHTALKKYFKIKTNQQIKVLAYLEKPSNNAKQFFIRRNEYDQVFWSSSSKVITGSFLSYHIEKMLLEKFSIGTHSLWLEVEIINES